MIGHHNGQPVYELQAPASEGPPVGLWNLGGHIAISTPPRAPCRRSGWMPSASTAHCTFRLDSSATPKAPRWVVLRRGHDLQIYKDFTDQIQGLLGATRHRMSGVMMCLPAVCRVYLPLQSIALRGAILRARAPCSVRTADALLHLCHGKHVCRRQAASEREDRGGLRRPDQCIKSVNGAYAGSLGVALGPEGIHFLLRAGPGDAKAPGGRCAFLLQRSRTPQHRGVTRAAGDPGCQFQYQGQLPCRRAASQKVSLVRHWHENTLLDGIRSQ